MSVAVNSDFEFSESQTDFLPGRLWGGKCFVSGCAFDAHFCRCRMPLRGISRRMRLEDAQSWLA